MRAAWMRAGAELRARWRSWLLLSLMLGLAGAACLTTAAGARRTRGVFDRLVRVTKGHDVQLQENGEPDQALLERVAKLPQVAAAGRFGIVVADVANSRAPFAWTVQVGARADASLGQTVDVPRILAGRTPRPDDPSEALANSDFMRTRHLKLGDTFAMRTLTFDELGQLFSGTAPKPTGPIIQVHIVGVGQLPDEVGFTQESKGLLLLTPAFYRAYRDKLATLDVMMVRLVHGEDDLASFSAAAQHLAGEQQALGITSRSALADQVDDALGTQAGALIVFSVVVAAASFLLIGQGMGRAVWISTQNDPTLRALGAGRGGLLAGAMIPVAGVALIGAAIASVGAILGSTLMPVGFARSIDPALGIRVDGPVIAIGSAVLIVLTCIRGGASAVWAGRRFGSEAKRSPSSVPSALSRAGAPVEIVCGSRFAFDPGTGRASLPVRGVLAGIVVGVIAMTAALTFEGSFHRLLHDPSSYGWQWDVLVAGGEDPAVVASTSKQLSGSSLVSGFAVAHTSSIIYHGKDLTALALTSKKGGVALRTLDGRDPRSPDEVALGSITMRDAHVGIGEEIAFDGAPEACGGRESCSLTYRVTARVLFWEQNGRPGVGAVFTPEGEKRLASSNGFDDLVVRLAPGVTVKRFREALGRSEGDSTEPQPPTDVQNLGRGRGLVVALTAILALLAIATIATSLVTSVARRARDVAVLKVLGFRRSQVRRTVAWQASLALAVALIIGVPLGVAAGRGLWRVLASGMGVANEPVVPALKLLGGAAALLIVSNVVAASPARRAARTKAALTLRAE